MDMFLTDETSLAGYNTARDGGINTICQHFTTELFGVEALGAAV